jgi:hypothetical protein
MGLGFNPTAVAALGHIAAAVVPLVPAGGGVISQAIIGAPGGLAVLMPETKRTAQQAG